MSRPGVAHVSVHCLALVERLRALGREVIMPRHMTAVRERKADGSLLTEVDIAAQKWLTQRLPQIIDCPVLGEEMTEAEQRSLWLQGGDGLWIIDPIDGTTNFINGIPFFGTSVAYYRGALPQIACVYNPAADEAFYAERAQGAYMNGMRLPLRRPHANLADCVAGVDFKRVPKPLADRLAKCPPYYSQRNFGSSAIEWCFVAAGRLDLYLHGGQMLWDYAAGRLILEEAGGSMCTPDDDDFDQADIWRRAVVGAGDPRAFRAWADWLRQQPAALTA